MTIALLPAGIATAGTAEACAAAPAEVAFTDVEEGDLFADEILCVAGYRIVGGYSDGSFKPAANVTRGQAARFLVGFVETAQGTALPVPAENPFDDVPDDGTFRDDILKLHAAGIIDGVSDSEYNPNGTLTRGQMSKVVVLGLEHLGLVLDSADAGFTDVPEGGTFKPFIDKLANEQIVGGYPDGTFKPNRTIQRNQLSKFVANGAGFADDRNEWEPTQLLGPVLETSTASVEAGGEIEVTVTVYDEDANPVADTAIDAFAVPAQDSFDQDGNPNYASGVSINGGGNRTGGDPLAPLTGSGQGVRDSNDPTTDANGQLTLTVSSDTAQQIVLIAWRGDEGTEFNNETIAAEDRGSLPLTFTEPPASIGVTGDREGDLYPYGDDAEITAQLLDENGDVVNQQGASLRYEVTRGGGGLESGEVVKQGTVTTDAGGRATFVAPAPDDPNADEDNETTDTIHVFYDQDGDNTQGESETVEGELQVTYDDTPEDEVDDASISFQASNNPYDATLNSSLVSQDLTALVTVENVYGDPVPGVAVTFEFETDPSQTVQTDADGVARAAYEGPPAAQVEEITATVDGNGDGDTDDTGSTLQPGPDFSAGTLTQYWVIRATRSGHDTTNGGDGRAIAGVDAGSNLVDVAGDLRRYLYDSDDAFTIDGEQATLNAFEQAIGNAGSADRLVVDFEPGATSTYDFTNG